jgi:hypothetical protein
VLIALLGLPAPAAADVACRTGAEQLALNDAWRDCIIADARRRARSDDPPEVIATAALGACVGQRQAAIDFAKRCDGRAWAKVMASGLDGLARQSAIYAVAAERRELGR